MPAVTKTGGVSTVWQVFNRGLQREHLTTSLLVNPAFHWQHSRQGASLL